MWKIFFSFHPYPNINLKTKIFMKTFFLSLLTILLPFVASADAVEIDGIYYNLDADAKTAEVTYNPAIYSVGGVDFYYSGRVKIPASVTYEEVEYNVSSIGIKAFADCMNLSSVVIPSTVALIGESAFVGCSRLAYAIIPDGVTSIEKFTFDGCTNLTQVTLPNSVTSIGDYAFSHCGNLRLFSLPNSLTTIGHYAFGDCSSLPSITIPEGVTTISGFAFYSCYGLTSVILPSTLTSIEEYAFDNCRGLTSIILPSGLKSIGTYAFSRCYNLTSITIPDSVTSLEGKVFNSCSSLTSVTIGNSVKTIESQSFAYCKSLTTVCIGNSVNRIWNWAFADCPALTDVFCLAEDVPIVNRDAFENSPIEEATLHVPANAIEAYKEKSPWNTFKDIVAWDGQSIETLEYSSPAAPISIYTIDGKLLESATGQNDAAAIINHLPYGTTAIVKVGDKSVKVMKR